jgi:phosphotransferase family enzyme
MPDRFSIAPDPALPQLGRMLDARFVREILAAQLDSPRARRGRVLACAVEHIRYKRGQSCLIAYRADTEDAETGERCEARYSARVWPRGESAHRFEKSRRGSLVVPRLGPALFHLEPLSAIFWAFPNDRKLGNMSALTNPVLLETEILPSVVGAYLGAGWRLSSWTSSVVHYVPEHGLTVRARLCLGHRASDRAIVKEVFAKQYPSDSGRIAFEAMHALWASRTRRQGDLTTARPLAYQPERALLWQEALAGESLARRLDGNAMDAGDWTRVARGLAAFQAARLPGLCANGATDTVERLERACALLAEVLPHQGGRVRALVDALLPGAQALAAGPRATLHGDLHPQNILLGDGGAALIDMDSVSSGPPLADIGSLIAALLARAADGGGSGRSVERGIDTLAESYRAHVPWPAPRADIDWHTAAALVSERAVRCVTRLKPGRLALIDGLLATAERLVRRTAAAEVAHA